MMLTPKRGQELGGGGGVRWVEYVGNVCRLCRRQSGRRSGRRSGRTVLLDLGCTRLVVRRVVRLMYSCAVSSACGIHVPCVTLYCSAVVVLCCAVVSCRVKTPGVVL